MLQPDVGVIKLGRGGAPALIVQPFDAEHIMHSTVLEARVEIRQSSNVLVMLST
jgi:hypothetical protein